MKISDQFHLGSKGQRILRMTPGFPACTREWQHRVTETGSSEERTQSGDVRSKFERSLRHLSQFSGLTPVLTTS